MGATIFLWSPGQCSRPLPQKALTLIFLKEDAARNSTQRMQRWDPENAAQDHNRGGERSILLLRPTWSRVRRRLERQPSHRPRPRPSAAPSSTAGTSNVGAACSASRPSCSRASLVQAMGARADDLPHPAARQLCPCALLPAAPKSGEELGSAAPNFQPFRAIPTVH